MKKRFLLVVAAVLALSSCTVDPAIDTVGPLENGFFVFAVDTATGLPVEGFILAEQTTTEGLLSESFELDTQGRAYLPVDRGEWNLQVVDITGQLLTCSGPPVLEVDPTRVTQVVFGCTY